MTDALRDMSPDDVRAKARRDAREILDGRWAPLALPVDPVVIARSLGLKVFNARLADDAFGMLVGNDGGADIYLDRSQPRLRYRFTCAHEIGHYVLRSAEMTPDTAYVDRHSDEHRDSPDEVYANEFAAALLMPELLLRAGISAGEDDHDLARHFDVSLDALAHRRRLLGV